MPRPVFDTPPSYEPTESGYYELPEENNREQKAIVVSDRTQLYIFRRIDDIDPRDIEPSGPYPRRPHVWILRSEPGSRTQVFIRLNNGHSDIMFSVKFDTNESVRVHVPLDSWCRRTCDTRSVQAAIQQAYLNLRRGMPVTPVIVNPSREPLKVMTPEEYRRLAQPVVFPRSRTISQPHYVDTGKRPVQVPYRPPTPPLRSSQRDSDRSRSSAYYSTDSDQVIYYADDRHRSYHYVTAGSEIRPRRRSKSFFSKIFS